MNLKLILHSSASETGEICPTRTNPLWLQIIYTATTAITTKINKFTTVHTEIIHNSEQ